MQGSITQVNIKENYMSRWNSDLGGSGVTGNANLLISVFPLFYLKLIELNSLKTH